MRTVTPPWEWSATKARYEYTANGNAVNLCDAAADDQILISKQAYNEVENKIDAEATGLLTLKGFPGQTMTYNVL